MIDNIKFLFDAKVVQFKDKGDISWALLKEFQ